MKRFTIILLIPIILFSISLLGAQDTGEQDLEAPADIYDESSIIIQDTESSVQVETEGGPVLTVWDIVRMILIFAAIIAVIYVIFYFMRKAGGNRFQNSDLISMHATQNIGGNKNIHLIEVGQEFFLIGAADNSINLISKITEKDAVDDIRFKISTDTAPEEGRNFSDIFSRLFKRNNTDVNLGKSMSRSKDFMKEQRERLKNM